MDGRAALPALPLLASRMGATIATVNELSLPRLRMLAYSMLPSVHHVQPSTAHRGSCTDLLPASDTRRGFLRTTFGTKSESTKISSSRERPKASFAGRTPAALGLACGAAVVVTSMAGVVMRVRRGAVAALNLEPPTKKRCGLVSIWPSKRDLLTVCTHRFMLQPCGGAIHSTRVQIQVDADARGPHQRRQPEIST